MIRTITVLGVRANHPGPRDESFVTLDLGLDYLRGSPVEQVRLTEDEALLLVVKASEAVLHVRRANERRSR